MSAKRSQASASVRKRPQASASVRECRRMSRIVGSRKSSQNAELSSLFTLSVPKVSTVTGIGGVVVAKRRTVVTFGLVSSIASQKCQQSQGSGGRDRETQNCRHFWTRLVSSRLKSANSQRDRGGRGHETQNCHHFWPCLWREERRGERGEKRE